MKKTSFLNGRFYGSHWDDSEISLNGKKAENSQDNSEKRVTGLDLTGTKFVVIEILE